jgi:hypothetical protein
MARAVEYRDEWFPVVTTRLDVRQALLQLDALCSAAGRSTIPITAFLWELDEDLIERCAEAGIGRCVVYLYPERQDVVAPFLEKCARLAERFRD